ncbi:MAG: GFA family protein [Gammaproteobacteria bacterium]|nr:GFA family protein [Gammaproteobacteria bacterium]
MIHGQCLCGEVTFALAVDELRLYQCHCSECRRVSGSSANAAALLPQTQFRWQGDANSIISYRAPSGYRNDFCSQCGCSVPNTIGDGTWMWIPAGLLDNIPNIRRTAHIHLTSAATWETSETTHSFDDSPGLEMLKQLLHLAKS